MDALWILWWFAVWVFLTLWPSIWIFKCIWCTLWLEDPLTGEQVTLKQQERYRGLEVQCWVTHMWLIIFLSRRGWVWLRGRVVSVYQSNPPNFGWSCEDWSGNMIALWVTTIFLNFLQVKAVSFREILYMMYQALLIRHCNHDESCNVSLCFFVSLSFLLGNLEIWYDLGFPPPSSSGKCRLTIGILTKNEITMEVFGGSHLPLNQESCRKDMLDFWICVFQFSIMMIWGLAYLLKSLFIQLCIFHFFCIPIDLNWPLLWRSDHCLWVKKSSKTRGHLGSRKTPHSYTHCQLYEAPEVRCDNGKLSGAHFSDHGHVIIGMCLGRESLESWEKVRPQGKQCGSSWRWDDPYSHVIVVVNWFECFFIGLEFVRLFFPGVCSLFALFLFCLSLCQVFLVSSSWSKLLSLLVLAVLWVFSCSCCCYQQSY